MKTPMNLLDRLNGIYSAKSEMPINWLVVTRRDTLDLFFLRRPLLKRSMRRALNRGCPPPQVQDSEGVGASGWTPIISASSESQERRRVACLKTADMVDGAEQHEGDHTRGSFFVFFDDLPTP